MDIYIGCSGFHYSDWKGKFYPADLPKKEWLPYYAEHFRTVEINNTFYKMPEKKDLQKWKNQAPEGFQFTLKANRFFTHQKKLNVDNDFKESYFGFMTLANEMEEKLGCLLWQLPGNLHADLNKLENLCRLFKKGERHVVEFRHISWFTDEVFQVLEKYNASSCILSAPGNLPEDIWETSSTAYLRLHGKRDWYRYNYSDKELNIWANRIKDLSRADNVYVYFNNDYEAHAVYNAKSLDEAFH